MNSLRSFNEFIAELVEFIEFKLDLNSLRFQSKLKSSLADIEFKRFKQSLLLYRTVSSVVFAEKTLKSFNSLLKSMIA